MQFIETYPVTIASAIILFGWFISAMLTNYTNRKHKLLEIKTQYLIDAYQVLSDAACRENKRNQVKLEKAVSDIQLFGSIEEIQKTSKFINNLANTESGSLNEIIVLLRDNLRRELNLPHVDQKIEYLRFE